MCALLTTLFACFHHDRGRHWLNMLNQLKRLQQRVTSQKLGWQMLTDGLTLAKGQQLAWCVNVFSQTLAYHAWCEDTQPELTTHTDYIYHTGWGYGKLQDSPGSGLAKFLQWNSTFGWERGSMTGNKGPQPDSKKATLRFPQNVAFCGNIAPAQHLEFCSCNNPNLGKAAEATSSFGFYLKLF